MDVQLRDRDLSDLAGRTANASELICGSPWQPLPLLLTLYSWFQWYRKPWKICQSNGFLGGGRQRDKGSNSKNKT